MRKECNRKGESVVLARKEQRGKRLKEQVTGKEVVRLLARVTIIDREL